MGYHGIRNILAGAAGQESTAAAIAGGDLSRRIDHPPHSTEVGRLAEALNTMLGRIEAAYRAREEGEARALDSEDRMRRFVADASHELRTQLTSIRGLAEFSLQQGESAGPAELIRLTTLIQQEATRMGRLVEDLLLLARFDQDRPLDRRPVDLSSIAAEAVQAARVVQPGRPVALQADEPVIVHGDGGRLRQVIDNLIGNALQHTPRGSPVTVAEYLIDPARPGRRYGRRGSARQLDRESDRTQRDQRPRRVRAVPSQRPCASALCRPGNSGEA
jgi:two-component system OmpR family sensor kinase